MSVNLVQTQIKFNLKADAEFKYIIKCLCCNKDLFTNRPTRKYCNELCQHSGVIEILKKLENKKRREQRNGRENIQKKLVNITKDFVKTIKNISRSGRNKTRIEGRR